FLNDDVLNVTHASCDLAHGRGVNVDLDGRRPSLRQVAFKVRGDVDDERKAPRVHGGIYVGDGYLFGWQHEWRAQGIANVPGRLGVVFVNDGHRCVCQLPRGVLGGLVDRVREGVGDEQDQHQVVAHSEQLLDAQSKDVCDSI